jgi:hypothetical protein
LGEQWIRSVWSVRPKLFWESAKLMWSKECGWWWFLPKHQNSSFFKLYPTITGKLNESEQCIT